MDYINNNKMMRRNKVTITSSPSFVFNLALSQMLIFTFLEMSDFQSAKGNVLYN